MRTCDGSAHHKHETSPCHWKPASHQTRLPLAAVRNPRRTGNEDHDPWDSAPVTAAAYILSCADIFTKCEGFLTYASTFPACVVCWLLRAPDKSLSWWPLLVCSIWSTQAATLLQFLIPLINCFVCRCFCMALGPKPMFHHHNNYCPSSGKF
jgi:hypothetical protein